MKLVALLPYLDVDDLKNYALRSTENNQNLP